MIPTSRMSRLIDQTFAEDGPLAQAFDRYVPRDGQRAMAQACFDTLRQGGQLLAEAGTGIGKTFAYGAAALLSGRKVIISTATKNLQDQLFRRDLPDLCRALDMPARVVILKGRENYICRQRLRQAEELLKNQHQQGMLAAWVEVRHWADQSERGELNEVLSSRGHPLWDKVCARSEFCSLSECSSDRCHYPQLRADAEDADVLIVNHHLLGADLALRAAGLPALLPERDALIVDEAHQLGAVLTQALGQSASTLSWSHALREVATLVNNEIKDSPALQRHLADTQSRLQALQQLADGVREKVLATDWLAHATREQALAAFQQAWKDLLPHLSSASERSPAIKAQAAILARLAEATLHWQSVASDRVAWCEGQQGHWFFHATPMSIADAFSRMLEKHFPSAIFTSATLSVGGDFEFFKRQLGLWGAQSHCWESPYDYAGKAMLYLPHSLPEPNQEGYTLALMRKVWPLVLASGGRTFLLFTSYRAMELAAQTLRPHLPFPMLVQGEADAQVLVEKFRTLGNAVLLATAGFWEGVDVAGPALSLVVIDKIPFAPPDDPVAQARAEALEEKGLSAFACEQLPQAAMSLVQGAGRLIRSEQDHGVLVIGDPRLISRRYGSQLLRALPPMRQTRQRDEAAEFLRQLALGGHGT